MSSICLHLVDTTLWIQGLAEGVFVIKPVAVHKPEQANPSSSRVGSVEYTIAAT